jgi:hypothetical protein
MMEPGEPISPRHPNDRARVSLPFFCNDALSRLFIQINAISCSKESTSIAKGIPRGKKVGIAHLLIVSILVIVILIAGLGAYYFIAGSGGRGTTQSSSLPSTSSLASTTSTASSQGTGTSTRTTLSGQSGISMYSGTFNFTTPLGPGGERVFSNSTVQSYVSVQFAEGSFTFSINAQNYSGTGSGHGTMTVTTTGFCSGMVTVPYTFTIVVTHLPGQNITIGFESPKPGNATVPLTCTGPMNGVNTATNNPISFLPEYPGLVTTATMSLTVSEHLTGGTSYYVSIYQTS